MPITSPQADAQFLTLLEGEVTQLHVGLGTMNALFLKNLADKTRRGLPGRVEQGKFGGGNSYGYTVVKQFSTQTEAIRGDRTIDEDQAAVVQRIFRDYALGKSAKKIASELHRDGISAPTGGDWYLARCAATRSAARASSITSFISGNDLEPAALRKGPGNRKTPSAIEPAGGLDHERRAGTSYRR